MDTQQLAIARWVMVDCLAKEVWRDFPTEWHEGAMLEQLMHWYAAHDLRFRRIGFQWSQGDGFLVYRRSADLVADPLVGQKIAEWSEHDHDWYVGEAAIAAFLGLEIRGIGRRMVPTAPSLKVIYRHFDAAPDAVRWVTRETAKKHGMSVTEYEGLEQVWPVICRGEVYEDMILEAPTIKEQLLGDSTHYLRKKD